MKYALRQLMVTGARALVGFGLLLFFANPVMAQSSDPQPLAVKPATIARAPEAADQFPRTTKERFHDYAAATFSPVQIFTSAAGAGISQWRDYPTEWHQGAEGYGKRVASSFGSAVIENSISFGVSSVTHEDLRYPLSTYPKSSILKRAGHAISYTFVPKKEGGGRRFGWARLSGAYGAGFVANTWYPANRSDLHNALYLGTANLTGDLTMNLLREFIRPHVVFGNQRKASAGKKADDKKGN